MKLQTTPAFTEDLAKPSIPRATDLLELGMFREAMQVLERLPDDLRAAPAARRARLRAATGLGLWREMLDGAKALREGNEADKQAAAEAFQSLSAEACNRGREEDARKLLVAALTIRPDQLDEVLEDGRFPQKFLEKTAMRWK